MYKLPKDVIQQGIFQYLNLYEIVLCVIRTCKFLYNAFEPQFIEVVGDYRSRYGRYELNKLREKGFTYLKSIYVTRETELVECPSLRAVTLYDIPVMYANRGLDLNVLFPNVSILGLDLKMHYILSPSDIKFNPKFKEQIKYVYFTMCYLHEFEVMDVFPNLVGLYNIESRHEWDHDHDHNLKVTLPKLKNKLKEIHCNVRIGRHPTCRVCKLSMTSADCKVSFENDDMYEKIGYNIGGYKGFKSTIEKASESNYVVLWHTTEPRIELR